MILDGAHPTGTPAIVSAALKEKLRSGLHPKTDPRVGPGLLGAGGPDRRIGETDAFILSAFDEVPESCQ